MKHISLNWTLALKFSIRKKKRMRDCRILMAHDCISIIMRASYGSFDNKQKMCEKVNKDITFIQFFHSTQLHSTRFHTTPLH